ncbi:protein-L-isoaspartate(D-aspartate) O-methyltransferase [bacterium]|nr:protein-L-isoaspartate(D-aspartate) O-methyltransferase [bacterium]
MNKNQFQENLREKINREQMVNQLMSSGCLYSQRISKVFASIPRHAFTDTAFRHRAYTDNRLPIGCEQTLSKPSTVAIMTELLDVKPHHRVLEIGAGSGYQSAILAALSKKVYSIERHLQLVQLARSNLAAIGYATVRVEIGDGSQGWPDAAPFDRILFTAGSPSIPEDVCYQLVNTGVMVIPVGPRHKQEMIRIVRSDTEDDVVFDVSYHGDCEFVDLIGKNGW